MLRRRLQISMCFKTHMWLRPSRQVATRVWGPGVDAADENLLMGRVPLIKGPITKAERCRVRNKPIEFDINNFPGFDELRLSGEVWSKVKKKKPTPIQLATVPYMKDNMSRGMPTDLIIQDMTGSGKTLAYLMPILEKINNRKASTQAIIVVPTRELAVQTLKQVKQLTKGGKFRRKKFPVRSALCCGIPNSKMLIYFKTYPPHIVVGTPNTLRDLLMPRNFLKADHNSKGLHGSGVKYVVMDEVDEMLKEDHHSSTMDLLEKFQRSKRSKTPDRNMLVFCSAFISQEAAELAQKYMYRPHTATCFGVERTDFSQLNNRILPPELIHLYAMIKNLSEKHELAYSLYKAMRPRLMVIFIKNTRRVKETARFFHNKGVRVMALVGAANRIERNAAVKAMEFGQLDVLLTSGMGSRGINFPKATHVLNFDVPETMPDYLHRAGRLGRYGQFKHGVIVTLIQDPKIQLLQKLTYSPQARLAATESSALAAPIAPAPPIDPSQGKGSRSPDSVDENHESASEQGNTPASSPTSDEPPALGKNARRKLRQAALGEIVTLNKYAKFLQIRIHPVRVHEGRVQKGMVNPHGEVSWVESYLDEEIERRKRADEEKSAATRHPPPTPEPKAMALQSLLWRTDDPDGTLSGDMTLQTSRRLKTRTPRNVAQRPNYNAYQPRSV